MNDLIPFQYGDREVRTVTIDDEPWFVASDVAKILGYRSAPDMTRRLDDADKGYAKVRTPGGEQELTVINESGLYDSVFRSNSEGAKPFRRWVTGEVLPAIRRTGQYGAVTQLTRADLARMVIEQEEEKAALAATVEAQRPAVEYHERFIAEKDDIVTVDNFASQYGSTGPIVRDLLRTSGLAARKLIGRRWSDSKRQMENVYEWRARQGLSTSEWFDLRPQHNVPRLHNGQVRQTLYIRQFYAEQLAVKLGLAQPALQIPV